MDDYQPKISLIERFGLITGAAAIDGIGIGLVVFGLDDVALLDMFGATTQFYFRMRGINGAGYDLAATAIEFIPYIGALPFKTAGVLAVIWIDSHPTGAIAKAAAKAAQAVPVKTKGAGAVAPKKLEGIAKAA